MMLSRFCPFRAIVNHFETSLLIRKNYNKQRAMPQVEKFDPRDFVPWHRQC